MTKSVKLPPELKKRQLSIKQRKLSNFRLGAQGEDLVVIFLQNHKYKILGKNIRLGNLEIDIIALDTKLDEIVFCEVKTRSSGKSGHPGQAVNWRKIKSIQKVAQAWLYKHNLAKDYRFDIISVVVNKLKPKEVKIEHFENVTFLGI